MPYYSDVGEKVDFDVEGNSLKWDRVGSNLYCTLLANEKQKEIVRWLLTNYGLAVQGPTRTRKTHIILNIVLHLLSHGKKDPHHEAKGKSVEGLRGKNTF